MALYLGTRGISEAYLGERKVSEIWLGENKIFGGGESSAPIPILPSDTDDGSSNIDGTIEFPSLTIPA